MKTIVEWFKSLWARLTKPKAVEVKAEVESSLVKPVASAPKRAYNKNKSKTLSELLDNLDYSFDAMRIDYADISFLPKNSTEGLKKFGVSVIPEFISNVHEELIGKQHITKINKNIKLPTIIFMADNLGEKNHEDDSISPDFFFAIKQKKCPWYVAKKKGTIYNCGFGYRSKKENKILWISFFVTIGEDRQVCTTHQLYHKPIWIPKGKVGYCSRKEQGGSYTRRQWQMASWNEENKEVTDSFVCSTIASHFNAWGERRKMWSTTVQKDGYRAVFYINPKDTKDYFKNRDKVVTVNGTSKRIIHLVEEHERNYSNGKRTKIREHIRGLSVFSWNDYSCYVTAPEYHADVRGFVSAAETDIDEKDLISGEYVDLNRLAEGLHKVGGKKLNEFNRA
jgi:hypothetical protein